MKPTPRLGRSLDIISFPNPEYPITETLTKVFGGYKSATSIRRIKKEKTHDRVPGARAEVVSEQLCDDIIGHLAPSLEPYKGCTIIDVHPGACLWSTKLHEFLRPKRHILMEPEMRYYDDFVKPLLEQPGSTFRHTTLIGAHARQYWDNYNALMDDSDMMASDRSALPDTDPRLRKIDTSLLLTGNLWRKYAVGYKAKNVDHTSLILQHMTYAGLTNSIFHRTGLVRQLWWANDACKPSVFPTSPRSKRQFDMSLQVGAEITEVVGVERAEMAKRAKGEPPRPDEMNATVLKSVERTMAENGMKLPTGRKQHLNLGKPTSTDPHTDNRITDTTCTTIEDLRNHIKEHEALVEYLKVALPSTRQKRKYPGSKLSKAERQEDAKKKDETAQEEMFEKYVRFKQCIACVRNRDHDIHFIASVSAMTRNTLLLDSQARMINLEANYAAVAEITRDHDSLAPLRDTIIALSAATNELMEITSRPDVLKMFLEDIISCESQPYILHRDRRAYEPMQAHAHEFWPQFQLTLMDVVPREADLSLPDIAHRSEGARVCQNMLKIMFQVPSHSVAAALDRLAPNAAQDLLPLVPEIADARKGGRMDTHLVTCRALSREMVVGLVKAFLEWPFRPSFIEMELAQGEGYVASDEEAQEGESVPLD